eukprot:2600011-Rhodomonas_salina.3
MRCAIRGIEIEYGAPGGLCRYQRTPGVSARMAYRVSPPLSAMLSTTRSAMLSPTIYHYNTAYVNFLSHHPLYKSEIYPYTITYDLGQSHTTKVHVCDITCAINLGHHLRGMPGYCTRPNHMRK